MMAVVPPNEDLHAVRARSTRATAVVVGGGPAGLMAAERLARAGLLVTVYEQRPSVGRTLLLAGRSGLNITHTEPLERLVGRYGPRADRLRTALEAFGPDDLRAWCADLGQPTFEGSSGRVFPEAFRATPLLRAWIARLDALGVDIAVRHRWLGWSASGGHRFATAGGDESVVHADVVIIALGGASWPRVGGDGSWVGSFGDAAIGVRPLRAANVGVRVDWSEHFAERFAGAPLKNVAVTAGPATVRGDPVVTSSGLEGGPIYSVGVAIRNELDRTGRCTLHIDLHPDLPVERLAARLAGRRAKDSVSSWLRRAGGLHPVMIGLLREATGNRMPDGAAEMAALAKAVPIEVTSTMPIERAISSAGGVAFDELDERFMVRSRPGTFVAGEMLDWEAPTGGYLLQASFSTGVAAARGAIDWLAETRGA